jgi:hypothetical protein
MVMFRKIVCATVVAAALAIAPISQASAHDYYHRHGVGLGILGAAVIGTAAVVGAAATIATAPFTAVVAPQPVYAAPVYAPPPAYVYPYPYYYRR